jgi:hypothetical protein
MQRRCAQMERQFAGHILLMPYDRQLTIVGWYLKLLMVCAVQMFMLWCLLSTISLSYGWMLLELVLTSTWVCSEIQNYSSRQLFYSESFFARRGPQFWGSMNNESDTQKKSFMTKSCTQDLWLPGWAGPRGII